MTLIPQWNAWIASRPSGSFLRVVELGSFSKAAAELGVGQPAVTKQVARMETQLGARLLHRSTHGVTATEIGALYYEKCRVIAHHVEEADSVAALMQSQMRGAMRISTSVAFGRRVLGPLLMQFMRANPDLQVDLGVDDRYVDMIEQGIDVAIRMGRLADSSLGARYLGLNPWVLVASPAFLRRARARRAGRQDLAARDCLIYSTVQGDARWHFAGASGQPESVAVRGPLRSNSLSILLEAAIAGMGVAALPRYVAQGALARGSVVPLLEAWSLPVQEIHAVYPVAAHAAAEGVGPGRLAAGAVRGRVVDSPRSADHAQSAGLSRSNSVRATTLVACAGRPARGARRPAWRSTRAPCAAPRRRSRPGCRARRTGARRCTAACRRPGSARRTRAARACCSASTSGALPGSGFSALASSRRLMSTRDAGHVAPRRASISARIAASTATGSSSGIMRRSSLSTTLPGTTLVLVPPSMRPTLM